MESTPGSTFSRPSPSFLVASPVPGSTCEEQPSIVEEPEACDLAKSCRRRDPRPQSTQSFHEPEGTGTQISIQRALRRHRESSLRKGRSLEHPDQYGRGRKEMTVFEAHELASRFNLPSGHVTQAWKLFKRYDRHERGLLGVFEYQMLLRAVLRERYPSARDVPRELFERLSEDEEVDFTEFLTWITRNSFSEYLLLTPGQREIRSIARKFNRPVHEVESIKHQFDRFDGNGSGSIEYREFAELLSLLLGVTDASTLAESRIRSFWRELDDNGSGEIDFSAFIPWYITYFDVARSQQGSSPLEEFYRKIRPVPFRVHVA